MSQQIEQVEYEGWAIIELMGHNTVAGYLRPVTIASAPFLRVDIPEESAKAGTRYFSPNAIYAITPTTEEVARAVAKEFSHAPVSPWQVQRQMAPALPGPEWLDDAPESEE